MAQASHRPMPDASLSPSSQRGEARGGAGLGLSIARALLAANDATLDLLPTAEGSVFELVMPLAE